MYFPTEEVCDGFDNDGLVDEMEDETPLVQECYAGPAGTLNVGSCSGGSQTCAGGEWSGCVGQVLPALVEACNNVDDDCDGTTDEDVVGAGVACTTNLDGICSQGVSSCSAGEAICNPTTQPNEVAEICDGLDNDCDGTIDNGNEWADLDTMCNTGSGICMTFGVRTCNPDDPTGATVCSAVAGSAGTEVCDGIDNDCDGQTDEGSTWNDLSQGCFAGEGACQAAGIRVCDPENSAGSTICSATPNPSSTEICDGIDNDCDGQIDEDFDTGDICSDGIGECMVNGIISCNGSGDGTVCSAVAGSSSTEVCDGLDNDCDGQVDDGFNVGQACSDGVGACFVSGVTQCSSDQNSAVCSATAGSPTTEICDAIDNNCDGIIDNGIENLGTACSAGDGICQESGVYVCDSNPSAPVVCNAIPSTPNSSETCDYRDDDCDGLVDEGFDVGVACSTGQGVCRRAGVNVCQSGGAVCDAAVVTGSSETCNYLDDDCDGQTDEEYRTGDLYTDDDNCGACGISCNEIYDFPSSFGTCEVSGNTASCELGCDPGAFNLNGIPDDGCEFVLDTDAIYVSVDDPQAADDATCGLGPVGTGSGHHPCASITHAFGRVSSTGRNTVRVADALYAEHLELQNGINLLGGHRADTWERHTSSTLTTIRGITGSGHAETINATNITDETVVEGFVIEGMNATDILAAGGGAPERGSNSYTIYISGSNSNLQFTNNVIYAGDGAPGPIGNAGENGEFGTDGGVGIAAIDTGEVVCDISRNGGNGGSRVCSDGVNVSGGNGGGNVCAPVYRGSSEDNGSGQQGNTGENNGGIGGVSGFDGFTGDDDPGDPDCGLCRLGGVQSGLNGEQGDDGNYGNAGVGALDSNGSFASEHWFGDPGEAGEAGENAGGGGGGGAGAGGDGREWYQSGHHRCDDDLGGTGGGGGAGGCGGTAGVGGGPGGGSFAIFIADASGTVPLINNNDIYQARGGAGGQGGRGGAGGAGGAGATGGIEGSGAAFCSGTGGTGGNGGHAGHAGGSGGGAGGVSYGIFAPNVAGASAYAANNNFLANGIGGVGGVGGTSPGLPGEEGIVGENANVEIR